jgi:hypothetical protein
MQLESGTRLGPYEIVDPVGAGGMGEVYRAKDTRLGREAKAISQLTHPHICALYDVGSENGTVSFAAAKDGKRFIAAENPNPGAQPRLDIVVNWFAEVRRKVQEAKGQ